MMPIQKPFSDKYVSHRLRGPFPGQIDPWAEVGRYFNSIHAGMIGDLMAHIQRPLMEMGYEAGREASMQIFLQSETPELDAIYVTDIETGYIATVIEIVAPNTKAHVLESTEYKQRRDIALRRKINVIEIDLTRSVKHVLESAIVKNYAYHIGIYLPGNNVRIMGVNYGDALPRFALPLLGEVIAVELQTAYDTSYQYGGIAGHIYREGKYAEAELPFPSLLSEEQKEEALEQVQRWQDELKRLAAG